jgi:hypothetical protein
VIFDERVDMLAVSGPNQRIDRTITPDAARALWNELRQGGWYRATEQTTIIRCRVDDCAPLLTDDPGRVAWRGDRSGRKEPSPFIPSCAYHFRSLGFEFGGALL